MSMSVGDELITCEISKHYAKRIKDDQWRLSWLPGREFGRNEAISALTAADELAKIRPHQELVKTLLIDELGLARNNWPEEN